MKIEKQELLPLSLKIPHPDVAFSRNHSSSRFQQGGSETSLIADLVMRCRLRTALILTL